MPEAGLFGLSTAAGQEMTTRSVGCLDDAWVRAVGAVRRSLRMPMAFGGPVSHGVLTLEAILGHDDRHAAGPCHSARLGIRGRATVSARGWSPSTTEGRPSRSATSMTCRCCVRASRRRLPCPCSSPDRCGGHSTPPHAKVKCLATASRCCWSGETANTQFVESTQRIKHDKFDRRAARRTRPAADPT
jgi:hypothetical protein